MIIYRVSCRTKMSEHAGYHYFHRKRDALECIADQKARGYLAGLPPPQFAVSEWMERQEYPATRRGMIRALNRWGSHCDNG